ncbi:MAG: hypothetical protein WC482_02065, partial [Candidatus Omnitrophota bacterium]
ILLMLDASTEINEEDMEIIELVKGRKKLVIMNKIDLNAELALYGTGLSTVPATNRDRKRRSDSLFKGDAVIEISVDRKISINLLERSILDMVWSGKYAQGESAILTNARHKELLDKAFNNMLSVNKAVKNAMHPELIAVDLKDAIFNLGLIVGRSASDDILDKIFENFCIGK